tara:strand:- start:3241 stop:4515 length:1275 start_codon:yes stop_codon:yes gene_type:complete
MRESFNIKDKSFAVYGLGITGKSVVKFLKKNKAAKISMWDDFLTQSNLTQMNKFKTNLNIFDYIVLSPGINIKNSKFKKTLLKNKKKIITDLDLFYLKNKVEKSIVITGTNGKSTTCSLIHHIFKKNKIRNKLVGNIGKPVLSVKFIKKEIYIIEASSFQLEYSQFIKPYCAVILNISQDHLDWHGSKKNYTNSKIKIFNNQTKTDIALINDKNLKRKYKNNNFSGKLRFIKKNPIKLKDTNNKYLRLEANRDNVNFAYFISKFFDIDRKKFLKSLKTFNGLTHRHEIFYKVGNYTFINDSKATTFESTKQALESNDNIIWIVGGKPKKNDKISINRFKKKIIKAYVIGNYTNFFTNQINKKINIEITRNLQITVRKIFQSLEKKKRVTVLFSPASASYDQFNNFVERGEMFKNLVKYNAKKFN